MDNIFDLQENIQDIDENDEVTWQQRQFAEDVWQDTYADDNEGYENPYDGSEDEY